MNTLAFAAAGIALAGIAGCGAARTEPPAASSRPTGTLTTTGMTPGNGAPSGSVRPRPDDSMSASAENPSVRLAARCSPLPHATYRLGGDESGGLAGNPQPVVVHDAVGDRVAIWARFARRHLHEFSLTGNAAVSACSVETAGEGGGPAAVFEARSVGITRVVTRTDDCGPCAQLAFTARIDVHE